jgi:hypothetical protein
MVTKQKRSRLLDIKRSDEIDGSGHNSSIAPSKPPEITQNLTRKTESGIMKSENINMLDGEYEKLSVSIPLALFETLQDISRVRRRAKQKHTMSQMVREALDLWLENRRQSNSI